jgi:hypothetical protein
MIVINFVAMYKHPIIKTLTSSQAILQELFQASNENPNLNVTFKIRHPTKFTWWRYNPTTTYLGLNIGRDLTVKIVWEKNISLSNQTPTRFALKDVTTNQYIIHTNSKLSLYNGIWDNRPEWSWLFVADDTYLNETRYRVYTDKDPNNDPNTIPGTSLMRSNFHVGYDAVTDAIGVYPFDNAKVISWIIEVSSVEVKPEFVLQQNNPKLCVTPYQTTNGERIQKDGDLPLGSSLTLQSDCARNDQMFTKTSKGAIQHKTSGYCLAPSGPSTTWNAPADNTRLQLIDSCEEPGARFEMLNGTLSHASTNACVVQDTATQELRLRTNGVECSRLQGGSAAQIIKEVPYIETQTQLNSAVNLRNAPHDLVYKVGYGTDLQPQKVTNYDTFVLMSSSSWMDSFNTVSTAGKWTVTRFPVIGNIPARFQMSSKLLSQTGNAIVCDTRVQDRTGFRFTFNLNITDTPAGICYFFVGSKLVPTVLSNTFSSQSGFMVVISCSPSFIGGLGQVGTGIYIIDNNVNIVRAAPFTPSKNTFMEFTIVFDSVGSNQWAVNYTNLGRTQTLQYKDIAMENWRKQSSSIFGIGYYSDITPVDAYINVKNLTVIDK